MTTDKSSSYFKVLPPGSTWAIFSGSDSGNHFEAVVPRSGDYVVDGSLLRPAARRSEAANVMIEIGISGSGASGGEATKAGWFGGPNQ